MDSSLNTVPATGQVTENKLVSAVNGNGGIKFLFLGNSITRHSPAPEIGWNGDWGMAASCEEKDYVHAFMEAVSRSGAVAEYMIVSLSAWEQRFWEFGRVFEERYIKAAEYDADVIIVRLGENIDTKFLKEHCLSDAFEEMLRFFVRREGQRVIITDCFWKNASVDFEIKRVCDKMNLPLVSIGHIEDIEGTMAFGLFEHSGVAMHPSDKGMKMIAETLFDAYSKQ